MSKLLEPCARAEKKVSDSFQAYLVKDAHFTATEEYPIIPNSVIPKEQPKDIMPFNKALHYRGDLSNTFICFFSPDESFERVRRNPKRYIPFFKRTAGIIGFDYSIHSDMQVVKQKSQINDNLSLTYFLGINGIPVIPNIRCGIDELLPEFLDAIPKNSIIALGTHGFIKEKREQYEWYCFIETIVDVLNPNTIVVYGILPKKIMNDFAEKCNFVFYDSWIDKRRKGELENGN